MTSPENKPEMKNSVTKSPKASHCMVGKYATLQEFNDNESECWLYFIKWEGNEENLKFLFEQLESIEWELMEDMSTFDLDIEHLVCAQTAKEVTTLELNTNWHRKFDGKLQRIDFKLKKKDSEDKKMCRVFDMLSNGQIEDYVSDEDIDEDDLTDTPDTEDESGTESDTGSESEDEKPKKNRTGVPPALLKSELPRFAKAKGRR